MNNVEVGGLIENRRESPLSATSNINKFVSLENKYQAETTPGHADLNVPRPILAPHITQAPQFR